MKTLANIQHKRNGAEDLKSVVRTMKAMAASNIGQYELAVSSLGEYNKTVGLGILAYLREHPSSGMGRTHVKAHLTPNPVHCAIVFGSDQGLVGQFNESLADFVVAHLAEWTGEPCIWVVGERIAMKFENMGFTATQSFPLPGAVEAITPLISTLLLISEEQIERGAFSSVHVFHNEPTSGVGYTPVVQPLLPLNVQWKQRFLDQKWPTTLLPQVVGHVNDTLVALIHEYLFVTLYKACAESLASENSSRLVAMQRAEKNIGELLDQLNHQYHQLRQGLIDEELFDVISGFEALNTSTS